MTNKEIQEEALSKARNGLSNRNYGAIYHGFMAKGINKEDIKPRDNVFTFQAWLALGRVVKRGEHGVKVVTVLENDQKEIKEETGEEVIRHSRRLWSTTVFHISQTDAKGNGHGTR